MQKTLYILLAVFCTQLQAECLRRIDHPQTTVVPFELSNSVGCYHQSHPVFVKTVRQREDYNLFLLSPLVIQFENVPESEVHEYIYFESVADDINLYFASFICSGEIPLGSQVTRHSLKELALTVPDSENPEIIYVNNGTTLGTNYTLDQQTRERALNYEKFLDLYEKQTKLTALPHFESTNIYVPAVVTGITTKQPSKREQNLFTKYFADTSSNLNGCSRLFQKMMKDYDLSVESRKLPPSIFISKHYYNHLYMIKWHK